MTAPEDIRDELRRLPLGELLRRCSRFRRSSSRTPDQLATILALRSLAQLVGPIVAAQLIVTWSHHADALWRTEARISIPEPGDSPSAYVDEAEIRLAALGIAP